MRVLVFWFFWGVSGSGGERGLRDCGLRNCVKCGMGLLFARWGVFYVSLFFFGWMDGGLIVFLVYFFVGGRGGLVELGWYTENERKGSKRSISNGGFDKLLRLLLLHSLLFFLVKAF